MIDVIFGGQFGSEGKGLLASYLAKNNEYNICTTDAGPNAGHTAVVKAKKVVTFHLPMSGVLSPNAVIYLNGGSIIHPETLEKEIRDLDMMGFHVQDRIRINPWAAVIDDEDIEVEKNPEGTMQAISSTQKGVGVASVRKMMRTAKTAKDYPELGRYIESGESALNMMLYRRSKVCVEVAQGYSLGINAGFYPYCTHRVCTPAQGLMNAGLPTNINHKVWAVIRVNPIRVGSLKGGSSGDVYLDQDETTWEALKQEPQYTTVTKRLRRVFTFSPTQVQRMIDVTRPDVILINFAQTVGRNTLNAIQNAIVVQYGRRGWMIPQMLFGNGPRPEDITEAPGIVEDNDDDEV